MKDAKKTFQMIRKVAEWVLTIAIIALSLYCIVGVFTKGSEFYFFGYKPVVVLSGSMEPYMETNSLVIVKQTKGIQEKDVVMFHLDEDNMVCHRVMDIDDEGSITTKGDNNDVADFEKITVDDVEGKVVVRMNFLSPIISKLR